MSNAIALDWIKVADQLPPERTEVMTKIDGKDGCRNEQILVRCGRLWFLPDVSMYVYYQPTHWAALGTDDYLI